MIQKKDIHNAKHSAENGRTQIKDENISLFLMHKRIGRFGKKIGDHQELKYQQWLLAIPKFTDIALQEWTEDDAINFYMNLDKNKDYTAETKNTILRCFKTYMRWLCEEKKIGDYSKLAKWMKDFKEIPDIPALTKAEVIRLAECCNLKNKSMILTLFDTGARIQEFLNLRFGDIEKVTENDDYHFKINLRGEFSKTKGRKVSCHICKDALNAYLAQNKKKDSEDIVFKTSYQGVRKCLNRASKVAGIKKRVTPHVLRHSSATYYAGILKSPYQLEYRMGWSIGDSTMCKRYIDRNSMLEDETSKQVKHLAMAEIKEENSTLKQQISELQEQLNSMKSEQVGALKEFAKVLNTQEKMLRNIKSSASATI